MIYQYKAKLDRIVDGDTVWFDVDLGFGIHAKINFRLEGIDTPEVVGQTRVAGLAASQELQKLLALGDVRLVSMKSDKYGRWLARVYVNTPEGELNINQTLLDGGFAKPYGLPVK